MLRRALLWLALICALQPTLANAQVYTNRPIPTRVPTLRQFYVPISASLSSIDATGWSSQYNGTPPMLAPDTAAQTVNVSRQGFDSTGAATTLVEPLVLTSRLRQPYPNQSSLSAASVALSDYVYATDTIAGVVNNSAEASPKPMANVATIDQKVIGNTIGGSAVPFEVTAFHRNRIAVVRFLISDGTTTVTTSASSLTISPTSTDRNAVLVYAMPATDISGLANQAVITVNVEVYPRVGTAAAVLRSIDSAVARELSPRYFFKDTAKAAAPPYVCVNATTGVDAAVNANGATTGGIVKVSTNPAIACANPFATFSTTTGAGAALKAATVLTGGVTSGAIARVQGVATIGSWVTGTYQNTNGGALIVEGDPADSTAAISFGTATTNSRSLYTLYRNIKLVRTGTLAIGSLRAENVTLDNGSFNAALSTSYALVNGMTITNSAGTLLAASANSEMRLVRGVNTDSTMAIENYNVVGNLFPQGIAFADISTRTATGGIVAFNRAYRVTGNALDLAISYSISNFALIQNLFEFTGTATTQTFRIGGDSGTGNTTHIVIWNNTFAGYDLVGRQNWFYVDGDFASGRSTRIHKLASVRGNILSQINMKGDIFVGTNNNGSPDPTNAPNAIGNWSQRYGAGWAGNITQWAAADGSAPSQASSFNQSYPGIAAISGTSNTVRMDPLFVSYQGTTNTGTTAIAGAGGGDYHLQSTSPAVGLLPANDNELLPFDLYGAVRDRRSAGSAR